LIETSDRSPHPTKMPATNGTNTAAATSINPLIGHLLSRRRMDENDSWILYGVALDRLSASKLDRSEAHLELSTRNRKAGGIVALRLAGFENSQS
jgi:hypothetical protein